MENQQLKVLNSVHAYSDRWEVGYFVVYKNRGPQTAGYFVYKNQGPQTAGFKPVEHFKTFTGPNMESDALQFAQSIC